uniref:glycosyltransferase family 32 protein n=1 Tax=Bifidobacterium longum TaxID=216816 RepID=UPI00359C73AC
MIPKKIHFIWIGGRPKSSLTQLCMNSWRRVLTDYEIIEWNEHNLNLPALCKENKFLAKCVELKLWAFASDYLRLYILWREGGIYVDTDIEVLKKYDGLLDEKMFVGLEANGYIGTGVIGAERHNPMIRRLLDFYDNEIWNVDFINNPIVFKYLYEREPETFKECSIHPQDVFAPYVPGTDYERVVEDANTLSIHWYSADWNMSRKGYVFAATKHITNPLPRFIVALRKTLGYELRKRK